MSRIGDFPDDDVAGWILRSPDIGTAMAGFSHAVYNKNRLPMRVRELARIVIAHDNECEVCINTRDADGPAAGVDEELYAHADDWRSWPGFTEQERIAAEFAHRFGTEHTKLREREEVFHAIVSQAADGIALIDPADGRIVDANPAAQSMLGQDDGQPIEGQDLLNFYESGDSRERARRRIEELDRRPPGEGLPVTDFRLTGRAGRRVSVRATGVRVDAEGGTAMLSIYVDDTERRATEADQRAIAADERVTSALERAFDVQRDLIFARMMADEQLRTSCFSHNRYLPPLRRRRWHSLR
mgnify:CR=1 FL=1